MNITEVLVPAQETAWLPWAVQYFFYIGSAYAASILFFIAFLMRKTTSHSLRGVLALVMGISAIVGPLSLTADLHQPGRAWHFFVHLTPWSWMSNGSLFLPIFSMLSVLTAWLYLRNNIAQLANHPKSWVQKLSILTLGKWQISDKVIAIFAGLTVISGLSIALYTGMEIYTVATRPLWHQAASPLIWFTSAFIGALGLSLITVQLLPKSNANLNTMDRLLIQKGFMISCVLSFILLIIWISNASGQMILASSVWKLHLSSLVIGFVCCAALAKMAQKMQAPSSALILVLSFGSIATCWYLRWMTLMNVQSIPKYDVGFYPYHLPLGENGLLGIIAMAGLWIAMTALLSEVVIPENKNVQQTSASFSQTKVRG